MQKTKIEWCDYTWNPVIGCLHGCTYCYARVWAKRAGRSFEPSWSEGQYRKPYKIKEPSRIFVCSLADLFGDWVYPEWIDKVLKVVRENPQHTFQFLTKNPKRYHEFIFPSNCEFGTTTDYPETAQKRIDTLRRTEFVNTFVSVEPMLGDFSEIDFSGIELVIVGAQTGAGATPPKQEWIDGIKGNKTIKKIFWKENIKKYL